MRKLSLGGHMHPTKGKKTAVAQKLTEQSVVEPIDVQKEPSSLAQEDMKQNNVVVIAVYVLLALLGIGTGYVLSNKVAARINGSAAPAVTTIKTDKVVGSTDTKTFKDSAEGVLQKGGLDGEGTHHLDRDGGPSQTAYLISSVVDLDSLVGKKVKVWGQTIAAQKASWLMDVGKVELLSK